MSSTYIPPSQRPSDVKPPDIVIIEKMQDFFNFKNYSNIKDEISFSYDIKNRYEHLIYITNREYKVHGALIVIREGCFDKKIRELLYKSPEKQLKNFKDFLIGKFNIGGELKGWSLSYDFLICPHEEF